MEWREGAGRPRWRRLIWATNRGAIRLCFKLYFKCVHRIRIEGLENLPGYQDKLIVISNHASLLDGLIIWTFLKLPFKIIVDRRRAQRPLMKPFMQNRYTVQIDSLNPYSLKEVIRQVNGGIPLLVFPEGRRTSTGSLMKIYEGTGFVAYKTGAHILPLHLKNTYNTIFAKRKGQGRRIFAPLTMVIGKLREPMDLEHLPNRKRKKEATRIVYSMLSETFVEAHNKPSTLGREFIRIAKEDKGRLLFNDTTGNQVSYRKALVAAFALGRFLSRFKERNIGILLPNLTATALVFMGLQLFRKTAALLNYSSGAGGLEHAMELADLRTIVTSRQFLERIRIPETLFATRKLIFLEEIKGQIGLSDKLFGLFRAIFAGPFSEMAHNEHEETACILFTSGSEGVPKGVCLSHENIISNVYQGLSRVDVRTDDYFLNALPMFHSFGLTVGTIIPMFAHARVFFHVSPLHYRIIPETGYHDECTILLSTNTFLKGYGRRANPYDFHSMRYVFCGAEPLSEAVFEHYARTFGVRVMSGYGATECSPIVSINSALQYEYGTVGTVLPGMEYKLARVEGIDDRGGTVGKLFVRGKSVMKGYLKNEKANHKYLVEDEGWYDTGDMVEITEGGFLKIVGRLKRFAKISGEMVSLTAVEEALIEQFGDRKSIAVMAVEDERKGEKLVLVTNNRQIELKSVRDVLKTRSFSDLTYPREVCFMKDIPLLGTGKIDYVKLKEMI